MTDRNIEVRAHQGAIVVLQDGRPLAPGARVNLTAAELAVMVRDHALAGIVAEREAGSKPTAELIQATADAAAQAGAQAAAQPAFDAGARYAAEVIAKSTRIRRTVERDADGQITGTVEDREPLPSTEEPSTQEPARDPIGFHPR